MINNIYFLLLQTVNNNWIILRNIHRGRWYRFRVSAISPTGTYGYSIPTDLFILSSGMKLEANLCRVKDNNFIFFVIFST